MLNITSFNIGDNELLIEYVYEKDLNNEENIQK